MFTSILQVDHCNICKKKKNPVDSIWICSLVTERDVNTEREREKEGMMNNRRHSYLCVMNYRAHTLTCLTFYRGCASLHSNQLYHHPGIYLDVMIHGLVPSLA